eukprot:1159411-Pelagomonas_calceolata.AAC.5
MRHAKLCLCKHTIGLHKKVSGRMQSGRPRKFPCDRPEPPLKQSTLAPVRTNVSSPIKAGRNDGGAASSPSTHCSSPLFERKGNSSASAQCSIDLKVYTYYVITLLLKVRLITHAHALA